MPARHRPAAVAGSFYPAEARRLRAMVGEMLEAAPAVDAGARPPKLLVVPHAGYVYSGPIAASAFALLAPWRERFTRVVLLGPTHRIAVQGLALPAVEAFDTPLGEVPLDRGAMQALAGLPQVVVSDAAHRQEHALEVQLPFLQTLLARFALVPLAVGRASPAEVAEVLDALWGGDETLVVISTDLSHYLSHAQAQAIDARTARRMLALDATLAHDEACGATPLNGALQVARRRGLVPRLLDLRNSGDTAGDRARVVGYAALAFDAPAQPLAGDEAEGSADEDAALGPALLARARNAIAQALGLPLLPEPAHPALHEPAATFVTLRRAGALRGCIGRLQAQRSLDADVRGNALAAAFEDPRFDALAADEWHDLEVEVSVLDEPAPIAVRSEADALRQLVPGEDGVIFEWRGRRATFLPQVWEQLPQPAQFLGELKRKAGLGADFWHAEVSLARYRVRKYVQMRP